MENLSRTERYKTERLLSKWGFNQVMPNQFEGVSAETMLNIITFEEYASHEIKKILTLYQKLHPTSKYLSISIVDNHIAITNDYWDEDKDFPINVSYGKKDIPLW